MRPAYQVALFAAIVLTVLLVVGLLTMGPQREPSRPAVPAIELEPITLPEGEGPPVLDMLDKLEAAEVERFGELEAARRRRIRERLVQQRLQPDE